MLGYLINGVVLLCIATLVMLQTDALNNPLVFGYMGLRIVAGTSYVLALINIAVFLGRVLSEAKDINADLEYD